MAYDVTKPPAEWVSLQARRHSRTVALLLAAGMLVVALVWVLALAVRSIPLSLGALAVLAPLSLVLNRRSGEAAHWIRGARAETSVGETLNALRRHGYIVMHDLEQRYEGNIDHLVSGPTGVYMIETKLRRYEEFQLTKAKRQAARLHAALDVWVTPVICLDQRRRSKPFRAQGVWIVPRQSLLGWLRSQSNPALPFARLATYADSVAP